MTGVEVVVLDALFEFCDELPDLVVDALFEFCDELLVLFDPTLVSPCWLKKLLLLLLR